MNIKKHIILFLLKFTVVCFILLLPGFRNAYADFFRSYGNWLYGSFSEKGMVRFLPNKDKKDTQVLTKIWLFNRQNYEAASKRGADAQFNAIAILTNWYLDYWFAVVIAAFILASPIGWKRKLIALFLGELLMHLYVAVVLWVLILNEFDRNASLQVLHMEGASKKLADFFYLVLTVNPGTGIFVALMIWILVVFRKDDWKKIKEAVAPS